MPQQTVTVAQIMKSGIKTVPPQMTLPELEEALQREDVSGFPVVQDGKLVGVVSRSDVVRQLCQERKIAETVSDFHFDEQGFHVVEMESFAQVADRIGERIESLSVAEVMNTRPYTVPMNTPVAEVAHRFVQHHIHRLPVTDADTLVGIVTTMDLARLIAEGRWVSHDGGHAPS